jgi:hypothetical protein
LCGDVWQFCNSDNKSANTASGRPVGPGILPTAHACLIHGALTSDPGHAPCCPQHRRRRIGGTWHTPQIGGASDPGARSLHNSTCLLESGEDRICGDLHDENTHGQRPCVFSEFRLEIQLVEKKGLTSTPRASHVANLFLCRISQNQCTRLDRKLQDRLIEARNVSSTTAASGAGGGGGINKFCQVGQISLVRSRRSR